MYLPAKVIEAHAEFHVIVTTGAILSNRYYVNLYGGVFKGINLWGYDPQTAIIIIYLLRLIQSRAW